jgi:hypothetical protein
VCGRRRGHLLGGGVVGHQHVDVRAGTGPDADDHHG